jgi:glycosyltransferase involved in cell wall biosynthesis
MVVGQNRETAARYGWHPRVVVEQHAAVDLAPGPVLAPASLPERRGVFVARLLPWKGLKVAMKALAEPDGSGWRLDVYGAGPERERSERDARRLGISDRVVFHGLVPRAEVLSALQTADAMVFPSSHESAGWAVAEAISAGCPVVCFDLGGPGAMVGDGEGVKVPASRKAHKAFARALSEVEPRHGGSQRWSPARLPALLDGWYAEAAGLVPPSASAGQLTTATGQHSR